jgi:hypothetical protein
LDECQPLIPFRDLLAQLGELLLVILLHIRCDLLFGDSKRFLALQAHNFNIRLNSLPETVT